MKESFTVNFLNLNAIVIDASRVTNYNRNNVYSTGLVSISPTFYEQLLHQNSFCQKFTNPNCKHIKGVQGTLV
jgi:hypothetical protein